MTADDYYEIKSHAARIAAIPAPSTSPLSYLFAANWLIAILFAIPVMSMFFIAVAKFFRWIGRRHRERLIRRMICVQCGYDLRHSKSVCPECGTAIPARASTTG